MIYWTRKQGNRLANQFWFINFIYNTWLKFLMCFFPTEFHWNHWKSCLRIYLMLLFDCISKLSVRDSETEIEVELDKSSGKFCCSCLLHQKWIGQKHTQQRITADSKTVSTSPTVKRLRLWVTSLAMLWLVTCNTSITCRLPHTNVYASY